MKKDLKGQSDTRPAKPSVEKAPDGSVIIPDFTGWTTGEVRDWLHDAGLQFAPDGTGYAVSQDIPAGGEAEAGEAVTVYFKR